MRLPVSVVLTLIVSNASAETIARQANVIDADTSDVHGQRIRLLDIDAPESAQLCTAADDREYRCGQKTALGLDDWIGLRVVIFETT